MIEAIEPVQRLIVDLGLCTLVTWAIVECWHHGALFEGLRAILQTKESPFAVLLLCPFCLSHWVALGTVVFLELARSWPYGVGPPGWFLVIGLVVFKAFAVTRLSNLANDLFAEITRTPGRLSR